VAEVIRHLPPEVKREVRATLRAVSVNPALGEPLHRDLEGLWRFRVRRYRLVYAVDRGSRTIRVFAVGHRRGIYEEITGLLRGPARSGDL
jgi:mRNA interferase RelE/StbE